MRAIVLATAAAAAACGGHKGSTAAPKTTDAGPALLIKQVAVTFDSKADGDVSHVFLTATDETGKLVSYPIGDIPGACARLAADGQDLVTYECKADGASVRLHAIKQGHDVVVLRENLAAGATPDPMNRDEVQRITLPVDARIEATPP